MPSKVILLIGHSHWGKSRTLRALTGNQRRTFEIGGHKILIRRMSNDDNAKSLQDFVDGLNANLNPNVIIPFCPKRDDIEILNVLLRKKYQLYFWVLVFQYSGDRRITHEEINWMRNFGDIEEFNERAEAQERARVFRQFLNRILL